MDDGLFDKLFSVASAIWALVCVNSLALYKGWPAIMARLNERRRDVAAEKAGDWDRIRSERDVAREERDLVRDRLADCERDRLEWMARAVKAEATLQGWGEGRQRLAIEEAAKRIVSGNGGDV